MVKAASSSSSMASIVKAYFPPFFIFALGMIYQLVILPRSFPPSHYDVLGINKFSSLETVNEAYESISSTWNSGLEVPSTHDFIKVRYAYELLKNSVWKRDYDLFGIDENLHVINEAGKQYDGKSYSQIELPLIGVAASDHEDYAFNVITSNNFQSLFENSKPSLVQVYSSGSKRCAQFSIAWKRIVTLLEGVANNGMMELGEVQLASYFAERKPMGQYHFRSGLPSLVAFPPQCRSLDCIIRFEGDLSVDAVTNWFATIVLSLPRILYFSKESLGQKFLAKAGPHKVKVIFFSKTGERATPFLRQAARDYSTHASFAYVLWNEEESSVWWNAFEVESAPAFVFVKDPGVKPVVYHGSFNESWFLEVLEQNKQQDLPQLRSITSMEMGCDARGYSRAGYDTHTWYCAILVGRLSAELNKMRETMRRVQQSLSHYSEVTAADDDQFMETAAVALQNKRVTFTWLDGEVQQNYCFFYIQSETSYETCGPSKVPTDVPRLLIVRYKRNDTEESVKVNKKPKSIWEFQMEDVDPAAQLVVSYNGSSEVPEIIQWISKMVTDGDSLELPLYKAKTPELVPEDTEPVWSTASKSIKVKQHTSGLMNKVYDHLGDPRIGPGLLLAALIYAGTIWWIRSNPANSVQPSQPSQSGQSASGQSALGQSSQSDTKNETKPKMRNRVRNVMNKEAPPSMTDVAPKDAYEMPLSDSDSE